MSRRRLPVAYAAVIASAAVAGAAAGGVSADVRAQSGLSQGAPSATFRPAQYLGGALPGIAPLAVGGGQVLVEVAVTAAGAVAEVKTLRSSPPFTEGFVAAIRGWQFRPAERLRLTEGQPPQWERVASTVLAGSVIRPPALNFTGTLGQPPVDVAHPSQGVPFPLNVVTPLFPPQARDGGSVAVEVAVGTDGSATSVRVAGPAANPASNPPSSARSTTPPNVSNLVESALTAARGWTFRPAVVDGAPVPAYAYIVFVFRQPVLGRAH